MTISSFMLFLLSGNLFVKEYLGRVEVNLLGGNSPCIQNSFEVDGGFTAVAQNRKAVGGGSCFVFKCWCFVSQVAQDYKYDKRGCLRICGLVCFLPLLGCYCNLSVPGLVTFASLEVLLHLAAEGVKWSSFWASRKHTENPSHRTRRQKIL